MSIRGVDGNPIRFKIGSAVKLASFVRASYYPGIDHSTMLIVVALEPDQRTTVATIDGRSYSAMAGDVVSAMPEAIAPYHRTAHAYGSR